MDVNTILIETTNSSIRLSTNETIGDMLQSLKQSESPNPSTFLLTLTSQSQTITNNEPLSDKERSNLNSYPHPYFSTITKKTLTKKTILDLQNMEDIIIFSPHPDDEILGTSTILYNSFKQNANIKVIYMTSGKSSARPELRQNEAILALNELGGSIKNTLFTNMPFYPKTDRPVTEEDYETIRELLRNNKANTVFVCADVYDPNATHRKCFDSLMKVLSVDQEFAKLKVYFYYSVWYWPQEDEYTHIVPYDYEIYKCKIKAMLEHKSQALTAFMGKDNRPFYQRASARDSQLGILNGFDFCEVFYEYR
jgi:LmbE family N-acetylglucosaminyl deacetylase